LTMTTAPVLHLPDEPVAHAARWQAAVLDGQALDDVLTEDDGVIPWLWTRWRSVASAGVSEGDFEQFVLAYRREIWLWLMGERTWAQCCSGLIGRITRRVAEGERAVV
jgi:hypothetical protein